MSHFIQPRTKTRRTDLWVALCASWLIARESWFAESWASVDGTRPVLRAKLVPGTRTAAADTHVEETAATAARANDERIIQQALAKRG